MIISPAGETYCRRQLRLRRLAVSPGSALPDQRHSVASAATRPPV